MEIDADSSMGALSLVVTIINYAILALVLFFGIKLYMGIMTYLNLKTEYLKKKTNLD